MKINPHLLRPFGRMMKFIDPKLYLMARWKMRAIMGNPMNQLFLLPFLVRKNETVVDIGANIGEISIMLAKLVGKHGSVQSFEPITKNYEQMSININDANCSSVIHANKIGLSNSESKAIFTIPKERLTEATLRPHHAQEWEDFNKKDDNYYTEECTITTLDNFIKEKGIQNISFIKCDVEGNEFPVLQGGEHLLRSKNPPIILLEAYEKWTKDFGYHPREMFQYLNKIAGYHVYWISPTGLQYISPESKEIPGIFYQWVDFICIVPQVHRSKINVDNYLAE